jgi:hypothetical protein
MDIENISQKRELSREPSNGGSRFDDLYNLQLRTEQPRKKIKKNLEESEYNNSAQASFARRSHGIVGDYMKPEAGKAVPLTVDLTNGRLVFTSSVFHCTVLTT